METCPYCFAEVEDMEDIPDLEDDAAWERLSSEHAEYCEWVLSRAHRLEPDEPV